MTTLEFDPYCHPENMTMVLHKGPTVTEEEIWTAMLMLLQYLLLPMFYAYLVRHPAPVMVHAIDAEILFYLNRFATGATAQKLWYALAPMNPTLQLTRADICMRLHALRENGQVDYTMWNNTDVPVWHLT